MSFQTVVEGVSRLGSFYLRQGGYVIVVVCLSVCLLATLRKNFRTDLHEIFRKGWQWASEQKIKFWWRSGSWLRIRIATLVRRALAEVRTVPVLLVFVKRLTIPNYRATVTCQYGGEWWTMETYNVESVVVYRYSDTCSQVSWLTDDERFVVCTLHTWGKPTSDIWFTDGTGSPGHGSRVTGSPGQRFWPGRVAFILALFLHGAVQFHIIKLISASFHAEKHRFWQCTVFLLIFLFIV